MSSPLLFEEINSQAEFESLSQTLDYPFTQRFAYGEWHRRSGRMVRHFVVRDGSKIISIFQIIKYSLPFGKSLLYIPHGPVIADSVPSEFPLQFAQKLQEVANEESAIFARFDPFPPNSSITIPTAIPRPLNHSSFQQPQTEWTLDIQKSDHDLLAAMHEKTRYNIRLAERRGVEAQIIESNPSNYFDIFYTLLSQTAARDSFRLHPKSYYENIIRTSDQHRNILLVLARYQNTILAANLVVLFAKTAYYIFGGSSSEHRNVMAPHLAHWRTIQYLRDLGYTGYNFGGISSEKIRSDGWDGFSTFKRRFGGRAVTYGTPLDMVIQPGWYCLYQTIKRVRGR